jgi:predicted metal-dependent HD superfamily phosphohydrolase
MFETAFRAILAHLTSDQTLINKLWSEIASHYNRRIRHYHNLYHLETLLRELLIIQDKITDWQTIVFSIAYHDIIYNTLKKDNEEKSASLAYERLGLLKLPTYRREKCREQILTTKGHYNSNDSDTNYFTDADLAILGSNYFRYKKYTEQIRKEYNMYPNLIYKPGRQKVLKHFLQMPTIYKTDYFIERYEQQARNNIQYELQALQQ